MLKFNKIKKLYINVSEDKTMITLTQQPNERSYVNETQKPSEIVETSGSLAMLFSDGLLTMGQYDEFIASNPFAVDYSMYSTTEGSDVSGGFLASFSNAISTLGGASFGGFCGGSSGCGGFSSGGGGGGFSSVC